MGLCLIPCLPPFSFGCRDKKGNLPCQEEWYAHRQAQNEINSAQNTTNNLINEEGNIAIKGIVTSGKVLDAGATGSSNYGTGAEGIEAASGIATSITSVLAMSGALDSLFGGGDDDDDDDDGAANQAQTPLGSLQVSNTALVFGGIGVALLLFALRPPS